MQLVGARLELHVDVGPCVTAVFSRVVPALNLEFLDRVQGREDGDKGPTVGGRRNAIEAELHSCVAGTIGFEDAELRRRRHGDTGREGGQIEKTASVQRQVHDALARYHLTQRGVFGCYQRRFGGHLEALLDGSYLNGEVDARLLPDLYDDPALAFGAKAAGADLYRILARQEVPHLVVAFGVGGDRAGKAGGRVGDGDRCLGHNRARCVGHSPEDPRVDRLRGKCCNGQHQQKRMQRSSPVPIHGRRLRVDSKNKYRC